MPNLHILRNSKVRNSEINKETRRVLWDKELFDRDTGCATSAFTITLIRNGAIFRKIHPFIVIVLTLLCLLDIHVHCHFLRMPENVAGRIGELANMNCTSNDTTRPCGNLVWVRHNPKTSEQTDISMQGQLSNLVSDHIAFIDSTNGNCNLNATLQESAEGTYECIDAATEKSATAQLIVLEDEPECLVRTDDKVFNITCSVRFFGSWSPTMQWFQVNGNNTIPIDASKSNISGQIVRSTALLNRVNVSDERGHKILSLQCSMNFSEDRRPDKTSATNVPDYAWTSPIFGVENENEFIKPTEERTADKANPSAVSVAALASIIVILSVAFIIASIVGVFKWRKLKKSRLDLGAEVSLMPPTSA